MNLLQQRVPSLLRKARNSNGPAMLRRTIRSARLISRNLQNPPVHAGAPYFGGYNWP